MGRGIIMKNKIMRFALSMRLFHWFYITFYFVLALTGMFVIYDLFDFLLPVFGGIQIARYIHRIAGVGLIITPLLALLVSPKELFRDLKQAYTWKLSELIFFKSFIVEFFGGTVTYEPQGRFNVGEKLNILLQSSGWVLFIISGLVMWFSHLFSPTLGFYALVLHDIAYIVTLAYVIGHTYLATLHPCSKAALGGMITGYVDEEFAKHHYPLWCEQLKKDQNQDENQGENKDIDIAG